MNLFIDKVLGLIGELMKGIGQVAGPLLVLGMICSCILYGLSSQNNKEKYKGMFISIGLVAIAIVAIPYVLPWLMDYFREIPAETGAIVQKLLSSL